jgi:hypothetical protein
VVYVSPHHLVLGHAADAEVGRGALLSQELWQAQQSSVSEGAHRVATGQAIMPECAWGSYQGQRASARCLPRAHVRIACLYD